MDIGLSEVDRLYPLHVHVDANDSKADFRLHRDHPTLITYLLLEVHRMILTQNGSELIGRWDLGTAPPSCLPREADQETRLQRVLGAVAATSDARCTCRHLGLTRGTLHLGSIGLCLWSDEAPGDFYSQSNRRLRVPNPARAIEPRPAVL
jgi:hypothetical protein